MNVAWYYKDWNRDIYYYTESYSMSATEFANRISDILGKNVSASDISVATNWREIEKRNAIHI